jgi:hypothetical protein
LLAEHPVRPGKVKARAEAPAPLSRVRRLNEGPVVVVWVRCRIISPHAAS